MVPSRIAFSSEGKNARVDSRPGARRRASSIAACCASMSEFFEPRAVTTRPSLSLVIHQSYTFLKLLRAIANSS